MLKKYNVSVRSETKLLYYQSRRLRYGSGGGESCSSLPMISNMAEPIWVKLLGIVEDMVESDLAKEFF